MIKKVAGNSAADDDGSGHYFAYDGHARTLRTWLVAYGIGGPVLLISQKEIWSRLADSGQLSTISASFILGVILQVILSAINKYSMWSIYFGTIEPSFKYTDRYQLAEWLSENCMIDFVFDVIAMGLFGWATYRCFMLLVGA